VGGGLHKVDEAAVGAAMGAVAAWTATRATKAKMSFLFIFLF
jgi:hypothetical protein